MEILCPCCSRPLAAEGAHGDPARGICGSDPNCPDCLIDCLKASRAKAWDDGYAAGARDGHFGLDDTSESAKNPHRLHG